MKTQKTVILTDSKAALLSLTSNTPDQPIHQLLKDLQLLPHECTVVLQWIPAHCGIPRNETADHLAKSGCKQLQLMSTSTYQETKTCSEIAKNVNRKEPLETTTPLLTQSTVWQDMSRPLYSGCEQDTVACKPPEANWHHGIYTLRFQRTGTDGPPHPPGLSHLAESETPVMATGWVNHQQAVGNGGRPAPHHPILGNMWIEGLTTADQPQKKNCTTRTTQNWNVQ